MTGHPRSVEPTVDSPKFMAGWRQRLFNWLARWEEASLARALGLPVDRVIFVELTRDDD
jgi:hypothetical protein